MRIPSLHITEKTLRSFLEKELGESYPEIDYKSLAQRILCLSKTYSLSYRRIQVSNDKMMRKAEKLNLNNKSDAGLFSQILIMSRKRMKHRGIQIIKPGEKDWWMIKELTSLATQFCKEFSLPNKIGYTKYIQIGLSLMKNYSINKFKGLHAVIVNRYDATLELEQDKEPDETERAYKVYTKILNEKVGFDFEDYKGNPIKYVSFKKAKDEAKRFNIDVEMFIKAQFYAMEWNNTVPDPFQLYGDKAIERLRKYVMEKNLPIRVNKKVINWKKIKHG